MDNYICINGNKVELTEEQIKQLGFEVKKEKTNPFKRVGHDAVYYCISPSGTVDFEYEGYYDYDDNCYQSANYCTDKSLIEQRALHETLNRLLWRYSMEHDGDKIVIGDYSPKYFIYIHDNNNFAVENWNVSTPIGVVYFFTADIARAAIKEIVKPFMKEHPEFKW
jgi:hypothetical protein